MHSYLRSRSLKAKSCGARTVAALKEDVRGAVEARGARAVVLDLSLVPGVDASGVHGLMDLSRDMEQLLSEPRRR